MKCRNCNKETGQRSLAQNRSLHKWFSEKARQTQEHGVTMQQVYEQTMDLDVNEVFIKDMYKRVLKATYNKDSTTEMTKTGDELNDTLDHINRFFAKEPFFLEGLPLPSRCGQCESIDCIC